METELKNVKDYLFSKYKLTNNCARLIREICAAAALCGLGTFTQQSDHILLLLEYFGERAPVG